MFSQQERKKNTYNVNMYMYVNIIFFTLNLYWILFITVFLSYGKSKV